MKEKNNKTVLIMRRMVSLGKNKGYTKEYFVTKEPSGIAVTSLKLQDLLGLLSNPNITLTGQCREYIVNRFRELAAVNVKKELAKRATKS